MSRRTGIVLAYDKSTFDDGDQMTLTEVSSHIDFIKVGLEAMTAEDEETGKTIARRVREFAIEVLNKPVMWDGKFHDIGNTMAKAADNIAAQGSSMFTIHAQASESALRKIVAIGEHNNILPLAVTVLTDLDDVECIERYSSVAEDSVLHFADLAQKCGIRGIVCSPKELVMLENHNLAAGITTVVPGIRPEWASANDQKRVTTPADAARAGADYIVIGRPILSPPAFIGTPQKAAGIIRAELDQAFK